MSVRVEQNGRTTIFTLDRPDKANAINAAMANALTEEFTAFDASDQRVAIITGAGRHFCGGADLLDPPAALWRALPSLGIRTAKPVICAINGSCVGGAVVMAALADLCVMSENATFHYPEGKVGLTGGVIAALAARIPHKLAMEIMLLGRRVPARRAYEMGLVNQVCPESGLIDVALGMARELEAMGPLVLATLKRFVNDHTLAQSPSEKLARAARDLDVVVNSADLQEGVAAFRSGRDPVFTGK